MDKIDLRLIELGRLHPHEEIVADHENELEEVIEKNQFIENPLQCLEVGERFVILDGHHRMAALSALGVRFAPVQVVAPENVEIEYWYHVVHDSSWRCPNHYIMDGDSYVLGQWHQARQKEALTMALPNLDHVDDMWTMFKTYAANGFSRSYEVTDNETWVRYDGITLTDIVRAALSGRIIPPGVSRFVLPGRVLQLNVPLLQLMTGDEKKWSQVCELAKKGRVYDETVIVIESR